MGHDRLGHYSVCEKSLQVTKKKAETDDDVLALVVFGSYARGKPYDDVDMAVVIWPSRTDSRCISFAERMERFSPSILFVSGRDS